MKRVSLVFFAALLFLFLFFVGCGASPEMSISETNDVIRINLVGLPNVSTATVILSDADGVRYVKKIHLDVASGKASVEIPRYEIPKGGYERGKIVVEVGSDKLTATVSLPVVVPHEVKIAYAYKDEDRYVVGLQVEGDEEGEAVFGPSVRVFIGDMAGRTFYMDTVDTTGVRGKYRLLIPLDKIRESYTPHMIVKVKLLRFGLSAQVTRKAPSYKRVEDIVVKKSGSQLYICPTIEGKRAPIRGKLTVVLRRAGYTLYRGSYSVDYDDYSQGCYEVTLEKVSSPDGKADAEITLSYADVVRKREVELEGFPVVDIPDSLGVTWEKKGKGIEIRVCAKKGDKTAKTAGKLYLSIYDGKKRLYNTDLDIENGCGNKFISFQAIGPTSGGKATVYISFVPQVGDKLKSSLEVTGLYVKVHKTGYYYARVDDYISTKVKVVVSDARFFKRGDSYYFGIYAIVTNVGDYAAYVSPFGFDAMDDMGNVFSSSVLIDKSVFEAGTLYPGTTRRGWIFYRIPDYVDMRNIRYIRIGFENVLNQWYTLFTIPIYEYMYPDSAQEEQSL